MLASCAVIMDNCCCKLLLSQTRAVGLGVGVVDGRHYASDPDIEFDGTAPGAHVLSTASKPIKEIQMLSIPQVRLALEAVL